jgi:hypothetical protein
MLRKPALDNSYPALIAIFVGMVAVVGVLGPVHWSEWRHWEWSAIAGHFFGLAFVTVFVWVLAFQITEIFLKDKFGDRIQRSRPAAYFLCFVFVVFGAVVLGVIWSGPVEPGDRMDYGGPTATEYQPALPLHKRDELIWKIITNSMLPAMFGVRCALGPPKPKERDK